MIALGTFDENANLEEYKEQVKKLTVVSGGQWNNQLRDEGRWVGFQPIGDGDEMKVREVQEFLKGAGLFPHGKIDGICGYRTSSAIRLFQEYVRTVEGNAEIGFPDGKFGKVSLGQVRRWQAGNLKADWAALSGAAPSPEYAQWMSLLGKVKEHYLAAPSEMLKKLNAFSGTSDTIKVANWDFDPARIHMVGIRHRKEGTGAQVLDDLFILLIHGMVFKFFGSTEPGTKVASQYPFLVHGQHHYRFGWHHVNEVDKVFQALRPLDDDVLVVRSSKLFPTDADLAGPLDKVPNKTINIHWSAKDDTAGWSAGCQVLSGKNYINHRGQLIDCSKFAAGGYAALGTKDAQSVYQTKGAYTVLEDLVAALSGAIRDDNVVRYMLLLEKDPDLHPEIGAGKAKEILSRLKSA